MTFSQHNGADWRVWALLGVCAIVILGAMTRLTHEVLQSHRERTTAEARADLQERMRLALWRMDSAGASFVIGENQLSAASYHQTVNGIPGETVLPASAPPIRLRFELKESGKLDSPEENSQEKLAILNKLLNENHESRQTFKDLCQSLQSSEYAWTAEMEIRDIEAKVAKENWANAPRTEPDYQQMANMQERNRRSKTLDTALKQQAVQNALSNNSKVTELEIAPGVMPYEIGTFRPTWIGNELFLLRNVQWLQGTRFVQTIQGVWIDTDDLRKKLLAEAQDLLPLASLAPVMQTLDSADTLTLASVPFRLEPGTLALPDATLDQPVISSLTAGWLAALLAILTAAALVRGVIRLSERRASFVSAVTHELRTPLTTFRLYSDMLESGVVRDEKRGDYFRTLRREADRLAHLVENVLAFSRIERGSARTEVRTVSLRDLLQPMQERFEARLASAGIVLSMSMDTSVANSIVRVDAAAVEHILFNLIDNAAKYASTGPDPRVVISLQRNNHHIQIRVRDYGPGIPAAEQRKIFHPFHKSAQAAAESRPGVGLGLALSRRLADDLGGSLTCETPKDGGTAFLLTLPSNNEG